MTAKKVVKGATSQNVADVVAEVEANKKADSTVDPDILARLAQAEAEVERLKAGEGAKVAMAPGLVQIAKKNKFPPGVIKNPGKELKDLPKMHEVIDPETNMPERGVEFVTQRGNRRVDF